MACPNKSQGSLNMLEVKFPELLYETSERVGFSRHLLGRLSQLRRTLET